MPQKSKNKKRSPIATISIIAAVVLVLILGCTYLYVAEVERGAVSNALFMLRTNKNVEDKSVKELVTYTLPSGWTEDTTSTPVLRETGDVLLKSADFSGPLSGGTNRSGASVLLSAAPKYRFMTIGEYKFWNSLDKNAPNYKDVKVDGVKGIEEENTYYNDYTFIKGNYMIDIATAILSEDASTEVQNQYQKDINSIIDSIQFK